MRGVSRAHSHSLERDVEFLCRDLRQRGDGPLTIFDFPSEHFDRALGIDPEPRIETFIGLQIGRQFSLRDVPENATGMHREEHHVPHGRLAELAT
jgi:hypothetical protein